MLKLDTFLQQGLMANGYDFSTAIQQQFLNYLALLQQWNQVVNLTAIKKPEEMVTHHLLDSLAISPYVKGQRLLDVGTGAGLPGIPLAIIYPEKHIYLLDSNSKKTRFLTQVKGELKLKNITIVHARSEQYQTEKCFDTIMTRAFSSLKEMLLLTQHLLCPEGEFLAMKGLYPDDEIKAIPEQFKLLEVHELNIKGLNQKRCLVVLESKSVIF